MCASRLCGESVLLHISLQLEALILFGVSINVPAFALVCARGNDGNAHTHTAQKLALFLFVFAFIAKTHVEISPLARTVSLMLSPSVPHPRTRCVSQHTLARTTAVDHISCECGRMLCACSLLFVRRVLILPKPVNVL